MYLNVCVCDEFWAARNSKKWNFGLFRPILSQLGLFRPYFVCKSSFRVISMIKMIIFDQSKAISLILKIKESKIQKSEICTLHVYYSWKRKSVKYITNSRIEFTSSMFNNIFCKMKGKKVVHWWGPGGMGDPS